MGTDGSASVPDTLLAQLMAAKDWAIKDLQEAMEKEGVALGQEVNPSERTIIRWRSGQTTPTGPATRDVLQRIFKHTAKQLCAPRLAPEGGPPNSSASRSPAMIREMVTSVGRGTREISRWLETTTIGPYAQHLYRDDLITASADFVNQPAAEVFDTLSKLRDDIFDDLKIRPRRAGGRLMTLGMTSAALAHASYVLGHPAGAMAHARLARQCAEDSGHLELDAWAEGTQALIAEGADQLSRALEHVRAARARLRRSRVPGSADVRLACYEARITARMYRNTQRARVALVSVEDARDRLRGASEVAELDDIGGIFHFPEPKADMYLGQVHDLIDQPALAEKHAHVAIHAYLSGQPEECSYGDSALAHTVVASARLAADDLAGVEAALTPVLTLPAAMRIGPLRTPLNALANALTEPRLRGAAGAEDMRVSINDFTKSLKRESPR